MNNHRVRLERIERGANPIEPIEKFHLVPFRKTCPIVITPFGAHWVGPFRRMIESSG
jgi:hypothetical protein